MQITAPSAGNDRVANLPLKRTKLLNDLLRVLDHGLVLQRRNAACKAAVGYRPATVSRKIFRMDLIIKSGRHGKGVFAAKPIAAGQPILPFTGPLLKYAQTTHQTYALQIAPDTYIGASGNADDYVNHSCEPNAGMIIRGTDVTLVAIRDIAAGEEIFFDYSTTLDEDDFEFDCACGSTACRGRIRDGKHLPEAIWQRYLALGILPDYVCQSRAAMNGNAVARPPRPC